MKNFHFHPFEGVKVFFKTADLAPSLENCFAGWSASYKF